MPKRQTPSRVDAQVKASNSIEAYIATFAPAVQKRLKAMRATIRKGAKDATEAMSYGVPTFKLDGNLVHFAAFKQHIGFYPGPEAIEAFASSLEKFETSKGAIRFPLDEPIPLSLVAKIVAYRVKQTKEKPRTKRVSPRRAVRR